MTRMHVAVRVQDRFLIELDGEISKTLGIKNGQLFEQEIREEGILLRRLEEDKEI